MPKNVLDLRLYQLEEVDEEIIDRNGVAWKIYAGTPATQFTRLLDLQNKWPKDDAGHMIDNPDPKQMPADIGTQTLGVVWDNLRRANPGRTVEEFHDGILVEDGILLLNYLSLRYQLRSEEMRANLDAQRENQPPSPPAKSPSTSRKRRPASVSA